MEGDANLRRDVSEALAADGFKRRGGRLHKKQIDDDLSFIVDTGHIARGSNVGISPAVGIRSDRVEHLIGQLAALPDSGYGATVGAGLGYVLYGADREWFPPRLAAAAGSTTSVIVARSASDVLSAIYAGLESLHQYGSLEALPNALRKFRAWSHSEGSYTDVVVQLLLNDTTAVLREVDAANLEYCRHGGPGCEQFMRFRSGSWPYSSMKSNHVVVECRREISPSGSQSPVARTGVVRLHRRLPRLSGRTRAPGECRRP